MGKTTCLDCGRISDKTRCQPCAARWERDRRPSARKRGYDAAYERERSRKLEGNPPCDMRLTGCTGTATTLQHVDGVDVSIYTIPACAWCNASDSASHRGTTTR